MTNMLARRNDGDRILFPTADLFSTMDRMFGEGLGPTREGGWPLMDARVDEEGVHVVVELPGMTAEDVSATYEDGVLVVEGERRAEYDDDRSGAGLIERRYGRFRRALRIDVPVEADAVSASFENGLLRIELPRAEASRPRNIEIATARSIGSGEGGDDAGASEE